MVSAGLFQRINRLTTGSSGSCPPIRTAVVSGDTVASAAERRRQRRSIPETGLTSASETLHDQFNLVHRHQIRLRGCRCDRLSLDALLFLKEALKYCRGQPAPPVDRGEWYDWPLDLLNCEPKRETWGDRSLIEAWFGVLKFRTMLFRHRFPHYSTRESTRSWLRAFAALHNAMLQR